MSEVLLNALRGLRVADPDLGLKPLLAKLREQQPDLEAGTREVREALTALKAESEAAKAAAARPAAAAAPVPSKKKSGSGKKPLQLEERFGGLTMREWASAASVRHLVEPGCSNPNLPNRCKRLSELPPVVKRTLGRLPMLIAEANAEFPDRIRQCWFSPAMLDGRLDPEGPTVATVAVLQSFVPRARGPDGEWDRTTTVSAQYISDISATD